MHCLPSMTPPCFVLSGPISFVLVSLLLLDLDALLNTVNLALVDLLARLGDRSEDLVVGERGVSGHDGGLVLEGDFVFLDTCDEKTKESVQFEAAEFGGNSPGLILGKKGGKPWKS